MCDWYPNVWPTTNLGVILQDAIEIDEDLLANSARSLETLVSVGMKLGVATKKQATVNLPNFDNWVLEEWQSMCFLKRKWLMDISVFKLSGVFLLC